MNKKFTELNTSLEDSRDFEINYRVVNLKNNVGSSFGNKTVLRIWAVMIFECILILFCETLSVPALQGTVSIRYKFRPVDFIQKNNRYFVLQM